MVEGTPLLRAHLGKTWIQGSNPCVSARTLKPAHRKAVRVFYFYTIPIQGNAEFLTILATGTIIVPVLPPLYPSNRHEWLLALAIRSMVERLPLKIENLPGHSVARNPH